MKILLGVILVKRNGFIYMAIIDLNDPTGINLSRLYSIINSDVQWTSINVNRGSSRSWISKGVIDVQSNPQTINEMNYLFDESYIIKGSLYVMVLVQPIKVLFVIPNLVPAFQHLTEVYE